MKKNANNIFIWKEKERFCMRILDKTALCLVIIGAINWGLVGFFEFNLVDAIFGTMTILSRIIYALVGVAGI